MTARDGWRDEWRDEWRDDWRDDVSGRPIGAVLEEIAARLRGARRVLLTAHVNPDGDAFGSTLGLALGLERLGIDARVYADQPIPERFEALLPARLLEVLGDSLGALAAERFDLCVLLDTSEPERTGVLQPLFFAAGQSRVAIDHHRIEGEYSFDSHLVVSAAPATGCLVLRLLDVLGVEIDREIAAALWLAIASDTGWFRFSNTTPPVLQDASRLLALGLDPETLFEQMHGGHSFERTRLVGELLSRIQSTLDGRLVWTVVRTEDLAGRGVTLAELDGLVDHLKAIRGARVAALITERAEGRFKVSLRALGEAKVERLARSFGGGGHDKAAGFGFEGTLEALLAALTEKVESELVRSLAPER